MVLCPTVRLPPNVALPPTTNLLWLPETPLASCVRAVLLRDTRGVVLSAGQRLNHVAVSPYFSLTWCFDGSGEVLSEVPIRHATAESPRRALPGPILLMGPTTEPFVTYNPGPVRTLMLVFMPDALHQLVGLDSREWIGRSADAREVLPPEWHGWLDAVLKAPSENQALEIIENFLNPRWASCRPASLLGESIGDWLQSLAMRLALSGTGRSLRQLERRFLMATGNSLRKLRIYARDERAYVQIRESYLGGQFGWAQVAAETGFSDQSHMVRETVRASGFTPTEIVQLMQTEESFWVYRLWN
jgi:AraC-like DNA-binding protein